MQCPCKMCNGMMDDSTFGDFTEPATAPEPPKKSIYDQLSRLADTKGMDKATRNKVLNIMGEVDLLDGELHEIQKKLSKQGDGTEAREVAEVSARLY